MQLRNEYLSLITGTVKKDLAKIKPKGRNNKQIEQFKDALRIKKNEIIKLTDSFVARKTVEDTGFMPIDSVIVRQRIIAKPFDSQAANTKFDQKRISSRYRRDGKLLTREIERQNDICLSTEKRITSTYNDDNTVLTQVVSTKNGDKIEKFIKKGEPTRIVTTTAGKSNALGHEKTITERYVYAHLNKSPIQYMESSFSKNELEGETTYKTLRKTVQLKNGTKLQTALHNGMKMLVEIPDKNVGKVIIHRTPEAINGILERYSVEVQRFLA